MIKIFDKDKDYNTIARWWIDHNQLPCQKDLLPNLGFIVDDIVAGFVYQTDSKTVYFESIVSKKDSNKEDRQKALNDLIEVVINTSKEMGYQQLIFHTVYPHLKELGKKWGCHPFPGFNERFYKDLRSNNG